MPVNETPCYDECCIYYQEIRSPQPGESWNRCGHLNRRIGCSERCNTLICFGYADDLCDNFKAAKFKELIKIWRGKKI